ncbi:MAG: Gfo/Idh/MocA family oxidoreductase [Nitrospiraceae bacterium]|nr:Gfo/Idh/MocA family oxidoreductase [Nitrospiraceae bacterium]
MKSEVSETTRRRTIAVAVVGFGWMGRVHARAYSRVIQHFPELGLLPRMAAVADENHNALNDALRQFHFDGVCLDWHEVAEDPSIEAVSITAPNFLHREIAVAMADAGKHIWIEKPVGLGLEDARAIADALRAAGVCSAVGFNYRNAPAVELARKVISDGELGRITHARVRFFSDYAAHPDSALTWRFQRERGGNGALGDLASHAFDMATHLMGEIESLSAESATFISRRPRPSGGTVGHVRATGGEMGEVENEDFVTSLVRFSSGAVGVVEASRVATGEQNAYGFEIHGTRGFLHWDFRRMGELRLGRGDKFQDQEVSTVYVGPGDGLYAAFQPGSAISMGWDDLKVVEARNFLSSIHSGTPQGASIADALQTAALLEAVERSVRDRTWVSPCYQGCGEEFQR